MVINRFLLGFTIEGFIILKHWVTHWKTIKMRKVKVTVSSTRVSWTSTCFSFCLSNLALILEILTRLRIKIFSAEMEIHGTRTRNIQWTQKEYAIPPAPFPNLVRVYDVSTV